MTENHLYDNSVAVAAPARTTSFEVKLQKMLMKLRKEVAEKYEVPPYAVFEESSINDMLIKYPITIEELKNHLKSQFDNKMNWQNYGSWHVDHIIPVTAFNLSDPEQQKECFHFTNLQPLWGTENLRKSNKY